MVAETRLGRPPLPAEARREERRAVYLTERERSEYLRLYAQSPHHSESAFLAELIRLGADEYRRRLDALAAVESVSSNPNDSKG